MGKNSFQIHQFVSAPREKVYEAWADINIAKTWSCPVGLVVSRFDADLRVGGKFQLTMKGEPGEFSARGVYREIVPAQKIVYTFVWQVPDTEENLVTVEFKDHDDGTDVVLSVSGFSVEAEVESNRLGWASSLGKLAQRFTSET